VEIGSQARTVTTDYEAVEDRIDQSIKSPFENSQTVSNNPDDDPDQQAQGTEPTEHYHQSQYFVVRHFFLGLQPVVPRGFALPARLRDRSADNGLPTLPADEIAALPVGLLLLVASGPVRDLLADQTNTHDHGHFPEAFRAGPTGASTALQGERRAGRLALDVDLSFRAP
jgi:hypothetical protein